jgi:hypothetical protein
MLAAVAAVGTTAIAAIMKRDYWQNAERILFMFFPAA